MLSAKLFQLDSFKKQYTALLKLSVYKTIPNLTCTDSKEELLSQIDWNNLISIASILSTSQESSHLDAALRIAQTCILEETTEVFQKNAASSILTNLTNKRSIELFLERNLLDREYKDTLPLSIRLQNINTEIENSIIVNQKVIPVNRFQKSVYLATKNSSTVSISAPTSAGKSFILYQLLLDEITSWKSINIIYVVPTRALISQVEEDIRDLLKQNNISNVDVSSVPQFEEKINPNNVFVFTQERLHWFLLSYPSIKIDLMIVDEAHKIDDGNRGILLQQKIEEVVKINTDIKIFFSSPFTANPELLFENVHNESKKEKVNTQFVSVNQNLIYVEQIPRQVQTYKVSLCLIWGLVDLWTITLRDRPGGSDFKVISFIAEALSDNKPCSIIYANWAADAERTANILFDLLPTTEIQSERVLELIKLIKKTIHKDYSLVRVLEKWIAFHYGNMPLLIRQEIESLFKTGEIKFLICTSTLLEGMNLPAKTIFIRKPTRGVRSPLNESDFWNLAWRVGRLGKEFSWNIVCLDPSTWDIPPNPNKSKQHIRRALDVIQESESTKLFEYIRNRSPRETAQSRTDLESAFWYYFIKFLEDDLPRYNLFYQTLHTLFDEIRWSIEIPIDLLKRNPWISPIAQQELYDYFCDKISKIDNEEEKISEIRDLIPVYPEDTDAYQAYINLLGRIWKTLSNYPPMLNPYRAILLINWMKWRPLAYLISQNFDYWNKKDKKKELPIVIRWTMNDVESFVRFLFVRDSNCYIDILKLFLERNWLEFLKKEIPDLNLWLEFWVNQKTHLSLLSLWLSRSTVIELSEFITDTNLDKASWLKWLRELNLDQMWFSQAIVKDIKKIL